MTMPNPAGANVGQVLMGGQLRTTLSGPDEPARATVSGQRPSLAERTDQVNEALEALENLLSTTHTRLEPVLQPREPSESKLLPVPDRTDDGSWLADYLEATTRRIQRICSVVYDLTERIDV